MTEQVTWIAPLGLSWSLGLSGISLALVALTAVATPIILGALFFAGELQRVGAALGAFSGLVLGWSLQAPVSGMAPEPPTWNASPLVPDLPETDDEIPF